MDIQDIIFQLNKEKDIITKEITDKQNRLEEIDITIKNLLHIINEIEIICDKCNGKGQIFSRSCAEDDGDYHLCNKCHGKGKIKVIK